MPLMSIVHSSYKRLWSFDPIDHMVQRVDDTTLDYGYLITIPYFAGERRSIKDIIDLFTREAFEDDLRPYMSKKIAIVIGVNQQQKNSDALIVPQLPNADFIPPFAIRVIDFLWTTSDNKPNFGDINNFIKQSSEACGLISKLRGNGCRNIYIAKFDADTVSLNQCFSHYEERIRVHSIRNSRLPAIVTSGYITKHEKPEEHGLELGTYLDYSSRMATARHLPFSPYVTEANALILLPTEHAYLQEEYSAMCEMAGMIKEIHKTRHLDPYVDILFVEDYPIITDYRPGLIGELQFRGRFEDDKYSGWGHDDMRKLRKIWQTHYLDDYKLGHFQDELKLIFELEHCDHGYRSRFSSKDKKSVGGCIEFVIKHINRCFDPLTITHYTLPSYIRQRLGSSSDVLSLDTEYIEALANVLKNYHDYVGWRRPFEEGPSRYVLDPGSTGITIQLDELEEDRKLSDLGDFLYMEKLKEKLSWLLAMYAVKAKLRPEQTIIDEIFFSIVDSSEPPYLTWLRTKDIDEYRRILSDNSSYIEQADGTVLVRRIVPKTFREVLIKISERYGDEFPLEIKRKIERYVNSVVAVAHEKGLAVVDFLSTKLLLDYNKQIPHLLRQLTVLKKGEVLVAYSETEHVWTQLHQGIFNGGRLRYWILSLGDIGRYGCNALHILAVNDEPYYLQEALNGIDKYLSPERKTEFLKARNDAGYTPLELAFYFSKAKQVAILINAGADFSSITRRRDSRTLENESLLHIVAAYGNRGSLLRVLHSMQLMKKDEDEMLEREEKPDVRNLRNFLGQTPFHRFISKGNTDIICYKILLTDDNYDLEDDDGFTPLTEASTWNLKSMRLISALLVLRGANSTYHCENVEHSPFEEAVLTQDVWLVNLMLRNGADIARFEWLLHEPSVIRSYEMLSLLTNYLSKPQLHKRLNTLDDYGEAPIHVAIKGRCNNVLRLLLECGTDMHLADGEDLTLMALARKHRNFEAQHILRMHPSSLLVPRALGHPHNFHACTKHRTNSKELLWTEKVTNSSYSSEERMAVYKESRAQYLINRNNANKSSLTL